MSLRTPILIALAVSGFACGEDKSTPAYLGQACGLDRPSSDDPDFEFAVALLDETDGRCDGGKVCIVDYVCTDSSDDYCSCQCTGPNACDCGADFVCVISELPFGTGEGYCASAAARTMCE